MIFLSLPALIVSGFVIYGKIRQDSYYKARIPSAFHIDKVLAKGGNGCGQSVVFLLNPSTIDELKEDASTFLNSSAAVTAKVSPSSTDTIVYSDWLKTPMPLLHGGAKLPGIGCNPNISKELKLKILESARMAGAFHTANHTTKSKLLLIPESSLLILAF